MSILLYRIKKHTDWDDHELVEFLAMIKAFETLNTLIFSLSECRISAPQVLRICWALNSCLIEAIMDGSSSEDELSFSYCYGKQL
jgi:hypothetical protein